MGRGKKKGEKKEEKSEDNPTTSETPVPDPTPDPEESEEFVGLGIGGKKKNPRKKKKDVKGSTTGVQSVVPTVQTASSSSEPPVGQFTQLSLGDTANVPPPSGWKKPLQQQSDPPVASSTSQSVQRPPQEFQSAGRGRGQGAGGDQSVGRGQGAGGDQSVGRGRGLGQPTSKKGWGSVPTVQQSPPMTTMSSSSQPPQSRGSHFEQRPGPAPQSRADIARPSPSHQAPSQQAPSQQKPQQSYVTAPSLYKVPPKFESNRPIVRSRATQVLTNYLKMIIEPRKIYRYDIIFKPEKAKKLIPKAFALAKNAKFPKCLIAFDQMKNCYSLTPLPDVPNTEDRLVVKVDVTDNNGRIVPFEVSFKHTGVVDFENILQYMKTGGTSLNPPTETIQCVDVILRQGTLEQYIKCGRQFYKRPANPIDLGDGLEMWTGLFQSAICASRPFVNIDVVHKGFPRSQPLVTTLSKDFGLDPRQTLQQRNWAVSAFQEYLKGLRVVAAIGGDLSASGQKREFICNDIVGPANKETFDYTDPNTGRHQKMTVADFFTKVKGCRLQYPNLNCVWVGPRDKTIYYPMELLTVVYGQVCNKQLNEKQLSKMVREAATPPDDRRRKIEEVIKAMNYSQNETFKKFGLKIDNQFHAVDAKVLAPPQLTVTPGRAITPRMGAWQSNGLLKPEPLRSWGFIAIDTAPTCDFQNIITMMINVAGEMGMQASRPEMTHFNATMRDFEDILFKALKTGVKFLFVIVGTRSKDLYHKVKRTAERDIGILTQCIKEFTAMRKMNPQTARNILLKVNSKLMGINQVLDGRSMPPCLSGGDVMVVGADVTHPAPGQSTIPSIAAVTASIDPTCFQYNIELSIQTPKKEMIVQFEDMMVDHLKVYKQKQNKLPRKIFVFRDGVSEGQFEQVMHSELTAVHRAYQKMTGNPNLKPEVLFLLVQKRHHTRMFVPNSSYNVEPGTVVDKEIVHASELDFYLVSHQAIKGTARPTRYHAVCNDGRIPSDEVEQLTYYLCHLYSRCMRSVSYPTPTYYAHLACLRARSLTFGDKYDNNELEKQPKRLRVMDTILQASRMFFV
ncbi:argonaute 2 [Aphomia sociella]